MYKSLMCEIGKEQPMIAKIRLAPIMFTHVDRNNTGGMSYEDIVLKSLSFDKVLEVNEEG